jgi:hypothetical protein
MERASCIINYKFGYKRSPSSVTILFFLSLLFATQFQIQFSKSYPYCSVLLTVFLCTCIIIALSQKLLTDQIIFTQMGEAEDDGGANQP